MKVEKNSASATASMKVEKRDVDVRGQKPDNLKVPELNL
jgi:transcription elongation factor S-II